MHSMPACLLYVRVLWNYVKTHKHKCGMHHSETYSLSCWFSFFQYLVFFYISKSHYTHNFGYCVKYTILRANIFCTQSKPTSLILISMTYFRPNNLIFSQIKNRIIKRLFGFFLLSKYIAFCSDFDSLRDDHADITEIVLYQVLYQG